LDREQSPLFEIQTSGIRIREIRLTATNASKKYAGRREQNENARFQAMPI